MNGDYLKKMSEQHQIEHLKAVIRNQKEEIEGYRKYLNFWFKKHQQELKLNGR